MTGNACSMESTQNSYRDYFKYRLLHITMTVWSLFPWSHSQLFHPSICFIITTVPSIINKLALTKTNAHCIRTQQTVIPFQTDQSNFQE